MKIPAIVKIAGIFYISRLKVIRLTNDFKRTAPESLSPYHPLILSIPLHHEL